MLTTHFKFTIEKSLRTVHSVEVVILAKNMKLNLQKTCHSTLNVKFLQCHRHELAFRTEHQSKMTNVKFHSEEIN
jgi:hypothetical protein